MSVIACTSVAPEEKIVRDFFRASKLRDNGALGAFATASFEPRTEGTVQSLKVLEISPERTTPLLVKQFDEAFDQAKSAEEAFTQQKNTYQKENIESIQRVIKAEGDSKAIAKADLTTQTEWARFREDSVKHSKRVSDARVQLSNAKALAELSLSQPNGPTPDVTHMTGEMVSKDVTVDASTKAPDNQTVQRQLRVTLERAVIKSEQGQPQTGRWIVTKVKDVATGKTS